MITEEDNYSVKFWLTLLIGILIGAWAMSVVHQASPKYTTTEGWRSMICPVQRHDYKFTFTINNEPTQQWCVITSDATNCTVFGAVTVDLSDTIGLRVERM